jgi:hypothetical protein
VRRRLFSIASFLSLLLCAATVVLWVRNHFVKSTLYRTASNEVHADIAIGSLKGIILISHYQMSPPPPGTIPRPTHWRWASQPMGKPILPHESFLNRLGFSYHRAADWGMIGLPFWLLAIFFLLLPATKFGRWMMRSKSVPPKNPDIST